MSIDVSDIHYAYGSAPALRGIDLSIESGELLALLGPSGCGKTTLLRIVAGLEFPQRGRVAFNGRDVTDVSARQRHVGFVFQHYALFNHLSVFENVAFGLRVRRWRLRPKRDELQRKVRDLLDLVQLGDFAHRLPAQLSGGQRQRVALARALAVEPEILLLDEPFGALDARVRGDLRRWLRGLHDRIHVTSVFVTHDQEEAMEVADRIVVMNEGRIEQQGTPDEVYDHPASPFVLQFLGDVNLFHGRLAQGPGTPEGDVSYVRPHELEVVVSAQEGTVAAVLSQVLTVGPSTRLELRRVDEAGYVDVQMPRAEYLALRERLHLTPGSTVHLRPRRAMRFTQELVDPAAMI